MTRCAGLGCCFALSLLLGCGPGGPTLYPATGTVTLDGKAVEGAEVVFAAPGGGLATGTTDAAGKFSLSTGGKPGAPEGEYGVSVTKQSITGGSMPANPTPEDMAKMVKENTMPKVEHLLPPKYSTIQSSGLTATVTKDKAKNDFPLNLAP